jgi:Tol biopolymer transport system component
VSPDGRRLAVTTDDGKEAIFWIYDLDGATAIRRLTIGGRNRAPIWSADSQRVVFQSDRDGDLAIFWQRADGTGTAERLTKQEPGLADVPESISPDGKYLLFGRTDRGANALQVYSFADRKTTPFRSVSSASPTTAAFSPDGRSVAYTATTNAAEGGAAHIYVEPFPPNGTRYEIGEGIHPMWSPDGKQLFFGPAQGRFVTAEISTQPTFTFGNPVSISRPLIELGPNVQRPYDITPDGKLLGVISAGGSDSASGVASRIEVVLNWFDELKQRVPVK